MRNRPGLRATAGELPARPGLLGLARLGSPAELDRREAEAGQDLEDGSTAKRFGPIRDRFAPESVIDWVRNPHRSDSPNPPDGSGVWCMTPEGRWLFAYSSPYRLVTSLTYHTPSVILAGGLGGPGCDEQSGEPLRAAGVRRNADRRPSCDELHAGARARQGHGGAGRRPAPAPGQLLRPQGQERPVPAGWSRPVPRAGWSVGLGRDRRPPGPGVQRTTPTPHIPRPLRGLLRGPARSGLAAAGVRGGLQRDPPPLPLPVRRAPVVQRPRQQERQPLVPGAGGGSLGPAGSLGGRHDAGGRRRSGLPFGGGDGGDDRRAVGRLRHGGDLRPLDPDTGRDHVGCDSLQARGLRPLRPARPERVPGPALPVGKDRHRVPAGAGA